MVPVEGDVEIQEVPDFVPQTGRGLDDRVFAAGTRKSIVSDAIVWCVIAFTTELRAYMD